MEKWSNFNLEHMFRMPLEEVDQVINNKDEYLHVFKVAKRSGGKRIITNPLPKYKYLLNGIQNRLLSKYKVSDHAHGFVKNRSVVTGALVHYDKGVNATGSVDVKNFFDNIKKVHLDNALYGNKWMCKHCSRKGDMHEKRCSPSNYDNVNNKYTRPCEEYLANIIPNYEELTGYQSYMERVKELMLHNGSTPQGFPTSPTMANIALRGMDVKIAEECEKKDITYTRYADDLSFSTNDNDKIWLKNNTLGMATSILRAWKLNTNKKKTKYCGRGTRLQVCSVVLNDHPSLAKWKVKNFRAKLHDHFVKRPDETTKADVRSLKGWCSWLMSVNKMKGEKYMQQIKDFEIQQGWTKTEE